MHHIQIDPICPNTTKCISLPLSHSNCKKLFAFLPEVASNFRLQPQRPASVVDRALDSQHGSPGFNSQLKQ